jgi:Holliday junction resolvasome RuvABC DNA-binding subunit
VREQLAASTEARLSAEKDATIKQILQRNKELAVALKSKDQSVSTGQGGSTEGQEVGDNFFSKEQLAALKAKGFDDKMIQKTKDNILGMGAMTPPPASKP